MQGHEWEKGNGEVAAQCDACYATPIARLVAVATARVAEGPKGSSATLTGCMALSWRRSAISNGSRHAWLQQIDGDEPRRPALGSGGAGTSRAAAGCFAKQQSNGQHKSPF